MPIQDYASALESQLENIEDHPDISPRNRELLLRFERDLSTEGYTASRRQKLMTHLKHIAARAEFDFDQATEDDLRDVVAWVNSRTVSDSYKLDYRIILKRFYRWLNGRFDRGGAPEGFNGKDEHPELVDWINTNSGNGNGSGSKLPKDLLTPEEVDDLIGAAKNPRDRALIALLWDTGARIGELIDLTVSDIEDHEHGKKVVVEGKTGSRRIPLRESVPYVNRWLADHPDPSRDASLWCKLREASGPVSHTYINVKILRKAAEDAEIEKPVNPHHFRHSRATFLANHFTEAQLCEWFGWVQGSDTPAKYVHLSGRDLDGAWKELHGIQDGEEKTAKDRAQDCPRCNEVNEPGASFCMSCGQALGLEAAERIEETQGEVVDTATEKEKKLVWEILGIEDEAKKQVLEEILFD